MHIRKMMLKDHRGQVIGVATLRLGENCTILLPAGYHADLAECGRERLLLNGKSSPILLPHSESISLIGQTEKGTLFTGSTLPPNDAIFRLALLLASREEAKRASESLASPLEPLIEQPVEEISSHADQNVAIEIQAAPEEEILPPFEEEVPAFAEEQPSANARTVLSSFGAISLEDAESLLLKGEPFPLFEELIEGSHWCKIGEEACLIGILGQDEERRVLCGIAGSRQSPPECDDLHLMTFFPTDEEGEKGYYLFCEPPKTENV